MSFRGLLLGLGLLTASSQAQHHLVVVEGEKSHPVLDYQEDHAWVRDTETGELRQSPSQEFKLIETEDFDPRMITVGGFLFFANEQPPPRKQTEPASEFSLQCASNTPIEDVLVVLRLFNKDSEFLKIRRIGDVTEEFGAFHLFKYIQPGRRGDLPHLPELLFFRHGRELLSNKLNWREHHRRLDRIVDRKISEIKSPDSLPIPWIIPVTTYPTSVLEERISGSAELNCRIDSSGFVSEFEIKQADNEAFGEAALRLIRFFRFVPRLKDGQPVASKVILPFRFNP